MDKATLVQAEASCRTIILVECFLDSNHIKEPPKDAVFPSKRFLPAIQHMIGFKESLN
ncbi:MAG TPA: hypothetical protein VLJ17_01125 [Xanthobacteraceae bacterium]|nr:hypothetical protein [Xanthobacteraceae bacterium]